MVLQPMLPGLRENRHVHLELTNDEGFVDIVERGFDAGVRMGEGVHKNMIAVPLGGPVAVAVVASPEYLQRIPAPRHPADLARHNCVRFRFAGTGAIYKWEFQADERTVCTTPADATSRQSFAPSLITRAVATDTTVARPDDCLVPVKEGSPTAGSPTAIAALQSCAASR